MSESIRDLDPETLRLAGLRPEPRRPDPEEAAARRLAALPDASILIEGAQLIPPPNVAPVRVELNGLGEVSLHQGAARIDVGNLAGLIEALQKARWIRDEAAKLDPIPETPTD